MKFLEDTPGGTILGERKKDEDLELLMQPNTSNNNNKDDSSNDENQSNSDQVGVPDSAQNQIDQEDNEPENSMGETGENQQVTINSPSINQRVNIK